MGRTLNGWHALDALWARITFLEKVGIHCSMKKQKRKHGKNNKFGRRPLGTTLTIANTT